jgi:biotin carboxylase
MPFAIFATPFFSANAVRLLEGITALPGARLGVISQEPQEVLAPALRSKFVGHWRIDDALDTEQITYAAQKLSEQHGAIHRLFGAVEHMQAPLAEARAQLGIAGMSVEVAKNFRDKARMKDVLRAASLPCARHKQVNSDDDAWAFADEVGYPMVIKPLAGAATQTTFQVDDADGLQKALAVMKPSAQQSAIVEEFITGDERSFETITINGKHIWHSLTHYLPSPLDVMRNPWIQWCLLLPREIDAPEYDDIRQIGTRALDALGMDTGLTHLEWFRRKDGSIAISEVAARPPGAQITTMMSRANDIDLPREWGRVMIHGEFTIPQRKYAVGAAFLRGQGEGKQVKAVHGLEQAAREVGHLVCDARLPQIGQEKSVSYEGEGFIIVRHPETAVVEQALKQLVSTVRVELG